MVVNAFWEDWKQAVKQTKHRSSRRFKINKKEKQIFGIFTIHIYQITRRIQEEIYIYQNNTW
jgi:hypothetical protein